MKLRCGFAAVALLACCAASGAGFSFALTGDTPYGPSEEASFATMLRDIDYEDLAFVVHIGDFKNGWTSCGDAVFAQRREMLSASRHALVYLPGDNEWTDCWRGFAGGYDPLERLARLREMFFRGPVSLGMRPLALARQSDDPAAPAYPEHVRWIQRNVLFAGFNIPGGDNNSGRMPQEFAQRDAAARDWLRQAFALARRERLAAVVVLIHANPFLNSLRPRRGYAGFLELLAGETANFDGQVLLVHGDTHHYRIDRPLHDPNTRRPLENLTRVEVFGSPQTNWVRVRVDEVEDNSRVRFEISPGR